MAISLTSVLFFSFAISLMVQSSNSVKCYSCIEGETTRAAKVAKVFSNRANVQIPTNLCPDDLTDAQLADCPNGQVCFKLDAVEDGLHAIGRMCGPKDLCSAVVADNAECNSCETDKCNGAASITATALLITVPAFLWKFY